MLKSSQGTGRDIDSAKLVEKRKGRCEMLLPFVLSRKEGRKSCRLHSSSCLTGSSEPEVFSLASDEPKMGTLSYPGYCWKDWLKTKQNKTENP